MYYILIVDFYFYSDDIESIRFGYLDTESNFSLEFEEGQANKVYPGNLNKCLHTQQSSPNVIIHLESNVK